jgi:predicted AlkP superfamily phosphohydrolase/phosphomutase
MSAQNKVVVIGIDGGTFDIIRPLIQKGELPHLASLMATGSAAELMSTLPFVTPTAFSSIMTGVNPGKHSLFDFIYHSHASYDDGPLVNYTHIRTKTVWELLTDQEKCMILVTIPFTYPPPHVNGVVLCTGNMTEGELRTSPPELAQEVVDYLGGYEARMIREPNGVVTEELLDDALSYWHYQAEKSKQATLYLLRTRPWDLLMTVFVLTDRVQHYFWRYMDPTHPAYEPNSRVKYRQAIYDAYRKVDEAIGEILEAVPAESHVVVMSDHGFGPLHCVFSTNRWLQEQGLLHLRRQRSSWTVKTPSLERCMERIGLSTLSKRLPRSIGNIRVPMIASRLTPQGEAIDWTRTQAYATRWGISINLKSREPFGIVEPGPTYETLVEAIMQSLREIPDRYTADKPLFDLVARKEELYHGPYVGEAHDILMASSNTGVVLHKDPFLPEVLRDITPDDLGNGDHRREGILIMRGPSIEQGAQLSRPQLEDLAPTILYLMGLSIPDYMDGKVLTACLKPEVLKRQTVVLMPSISADRETSGLPDAQSGLNAEEEKRLREHLRSLGYLE